MLRFIVPLLLIIVPGVLMSTMGVAAIMPSIIFDVILIALSIRIVGPKTVRTVEFLGKYNRILRPGFHFIVPFVEWTKAQDLYRKNFPVEVEGVTSDNVTAYIGLNVIYYVDDNGDDTEVGPVFKSVYSIDNPRTMMKSTIDEQLRGMIVMFTHKEIFGKREEIGEVIEEKLREKLGQFGFRIDSIQVRDVQLEGTVMQAMNKVVESAKLKEAAYNEAEAQKIMQVKQAEAEKESKVLIGEGMAGQRMAIAKGFQESVEMIKGADQSLTGDKILAFLLDSSRIETLGNIGSKDGSKLVYLNENLEGKSSKLLAGSDIM
ncbi:MAG: SPFH domain-containing protein [Candidatus Gracilibacteria bacterium]|nr:SPFH domain-containing protein [Candidatus Gracilibacteria bacterium]